MQPELGDGRYAEPLPLQSIAEGPSPSPRPLLAVPGTSSPSLASPSPLPPTHSDAALSFESPVVSRSASGQNALGRPPLSGRSRNASFPLGSNPFMRPIRDIPHVPIRDMGSVTSPGKAMSPRISLASPTPFFRGEASPYQ